MKNTAPYGRGSEVAASAAISQRLPNRDRKGVGCSYLETNPIRDRRERSRSRVKIRAMRLPLPVTLLATALLIAAEPGRERTFTFEYKATVKDIPAGTQK